MSSPALLLSDDAAILASIAASNLDTTTSVPTSTSGSGGVNHVIVHAGVLFHVLDHHSRRSDVAGRVIGTLLGRRLDGTSIVEITNAFAVPHAERGEEVAIGKDYNKKMLQLQKRAFNLSNNAANSNNTNNANNPNNANKKDNAVVGWYATAVNSEDTNAPLITDTSSLIHEFYAGESDEDEPIHLVVDTRLQLVESEEPQPAITIKAFKSSPIILQGEHLGNVFHEIRVTYQCSEAESICLYEMMKSEGLSIKNESFKDNTEHIRGDSATSLRQSLERLYTEIQETYDYVTNVIEKGASADVDPEIGRQLADTVATVPKIRPEIFDTLFHNSLQDLLMVSYLSSITRTQTTIAEKLNASLGI